MRNILLLFLSFLSVSCSENPIRGFEISNYIRLLERDTQNDFDQLSERAIPETIELYNYLDEVSERLILLSGGYDENGNIFNIQETDLVHSYLTEIDFFNQLSILIEQHQGQQKKLQYLRSGLAIPTKIWEEYGIENVTITEAYAGLTISKNCVLKSINVE